MIFIWSLKTLDPAIIFAPVGELVPYALRAVVKGDTVVCAGIHMTDIPSFPYAILWKERIFRSVTNLIRNDGEEFPGLTPRIPVRTDIQCYSPAHANDTPTDLRQRRVHGAAVMKVN